MTKGTRRQGREYALKIIYSFAEKELSVEDILEDFWRNFRFQSDILGEPLEDASEPVPVEVRRFTEELATGVAKNLERLDEVIDTHATNWALDRMARVDLALLRLGAYELLFCPEVPASVVINEAIEVGKCYGTKDTAAFINGILDKISRTDRKPSQ